MKSATLARVCAGRASVTFFSFALLLAACEPHEGDACTGAAARCTDPNTFLRCDDGHQVRTPCHGPHGCFAADGLVRCDESIGVPGEHCTGTEGAAACTADHGTMLRCENGVFAVNMRCRGADGCREEGTTVLCDASAAEAGDPCTVPSSACSTDGSHFLRCTDSGMEVVRECPGPGRCAHVGTSIQCDPGAPGDHALALLRDHFGCDGAAPSNVLGCAAVAAFAGGHAPTAPTSAQSWLGIRRCTREHHEYVRMILVPDPAGVRIGEHSTIGVSEAMESAWPRFEAALALDVPASTDVEVAAALAAARLSPQLVPMDEPHWAIDAVNDSAVFDEGMMGRSALREAGGRLYALEDRNGATQCIAELRPMGQVEIDALGTVECTSTSFVDGVARTGCEDGHTYAAVCAGAHCTCTLDGVGGDTFEHEGAGFLSVREMRTHCHYPVE